MIQDKIATYIESAEGVVSDAYLLLQEQAPQLVEEIVKWAFWGQVLNAAFVLPLIIVFTLTIIYCLKAAERTNDEAWCAPALCFVAGFIFSVCVFSSSVKLAVKAKVAPRVVVMEEIRAVMESASNKE